MNVWNWTSELSSRNLLSACCNQQGLIVNLDNTWSKWKWHVLNPPINKRDMKQIHHLKGWSHTVLLHIDFKLGENRSLAFQTRKGAKKKKKIRVNEKKTWFQRGEGGPERRWRRSWVEQRLREWSWRSERCREMNAEVAQGPLAETPETSYYE